MWFHRPRMRHPLDGIQPRDCARAWDYCLCRAAMFCRRSCTATVFSGELTGVGCEVRSDRNAMTRDVRFERWLGVASYRSELRGGFSSPLSPDRPAGCGGGPYSGPIRPRNIEVFLGEINAEAPGRRAGYGGGALCPHAKATIYRRFFELGQTPSLHRACAFQSAPQRIWVLPFRQDAHPFRNVWFAPCTRPV